MTFTLDTVQTLLRAMNTFAVVGLDLKRLVDLSRDDALTDAVVQETMEQIIGFLSLIQSDLKGVTHV